MACFCSLHRIYRLMFTRIETLLLTNSSVSSDNQQQLLRTVLPSVKLGDFGIEQNHHLQIKVLLQVSTDLLDRIDGIVDMVLVGRGGDGLFLKELLRRIMQQEVIEDDNAVDGGGDMLSLKTKVRNVRCLLDLGVVGGSRVN
ncbi:MAG: hypothetical protein Q9181_008206 [Wetmoreana brouardii]